MNDYGPKRGEAQRAALSDSRYCSRLREQWREWNEHCHPEDRIDWIEFYEEMTKKRAT